ncbi:hypothetical protein L1987_20337 [Smallanthus sonchifolius]|uniref:Uncharacterized protein n=1 Tax=Smallanthus sonchifolius TaxID=185202 RepID=A0ACB9IT95_9ASTR|nr:hypothetical protein L1987_20337 [Smallanthus sonchifolius]
MQDIDLEARIYRNIYVCSQHTRQQVRNDMPSSNAAKIIDSNRGTYVVHDIVHANFLDADLHGNEDAQQSVEDVNEEKVCVRIVITLESINVNNARSPTYRK